jgi:lipoyl-dependent peroxiredoxin
MATRTASATWRGDLKDGDGDLSLGSGRLANAPYTFVSRFETGEGGTNPEELVGAAHAACYSMSVANILAKAGTPATSVDTTATVHLEPVDGKQTITRIELATTGVVPGIDAARFAEVAEEARTGCPISRLLAAAQITVTPTLAG